MKGNRELDELLISYLLNELDPEEETAVVEYINSDDEVKKKFEKLQDTWNLLAINKELESVNTNSEWKRFEQTALKVKQSLVPVKNEAGTEENQVEEQTVFPNSLIRKVSIVAAVAASVILMTTFLWKFSTNKKQAGQDIAKIKAAQPVLLATSVKHEVNNTGKKKKLLLQDGSEIILDSKSEVTYLEPFSSNRRDITLKGKADFKVVKDKASPFTVYSMDISTTALGTHFTVSAFERDENITVKLFEGKVVIKSVSGVKTRLNSDYYLSPGQTLVYNNKNYTATLSDFHSRSAAIKSSNAGAIVKEELNTPEYGNGSWNMFNNQPANQVFDHLKILYNAEIIYSEKDVYNLYIIGKFDKSDSLSAILDKIAKLNSLKVTRKNNRFVITK